MATWPQIDFLCMITASFFKLQTFSRRLLSRFSLSKFPERAIMEKAYDSLIIGAGPAGLNAALGLGRVHRSAAVFSNNKFRNDGAHAAHTVLSRDHVKPSLIREEGIKDIAKYNNTTHIHTTITKIEKTTIGDLSGFTAEDENGQTYTGRTVILATGSQDVFPDLPGYAANWPLNIYQCPFCDGHERAHLPKGILAIPTFQPMLESVGSMLQHMSSPAHAPSFPLDPSQPAHSITIFTNGAIPNTSDPSIANAVDTARALGMRFEHRKIAQLVPATREGAPARSQEDEACEGVSVVLEDGTSVYLGFLFHKPPTVPNARGLIEKLGVEMAESPFGVDVKRVEPFGGTNVAGVYVAGDVGTPLKSVTGAMFHGGMAAAGVAHQCITEENKIALARWKARVETTVASS
ncbi:FAD/NAD(P)-binding domain-containing protein [Viridothelium virens]|uniref:FAD/NAD(P)-binding domain-containing protein n=1 Tax=Viridothelium virens TaxID=1048519 RepID=A0A6A6HHC0_VIRVR|nr:FAD/NAD(P)-binding domain-containing protein [Viridothelium virens]